MPKILVVEDTQDTRELLHLYFRMAGFDVVLAADGSQGLYMIASEKPDVIITDVCMPDMDGIEMIKQLRSEPETASIPIMVFTARGSETTKRAIEAGATKAFYKPFDFDELVKIVADMVQK
jgi:DNA-binding response OmpR family regulator